MEAADAPLSLNAIESVDDIALTLALRLRRPHLIEALPSGRGLATAIFHSGACNLPIVSIGIPKSTDH